MSSPAESERVLAEIAAIKRRQANTEIELRVEVQIEEEKEDEFREKYGRPSPGIPVFLQEATLNWCRRELKEKRRELRDYLLIETTQLMIAQQKELIKLLATKEDRA